MISLVLFVLAIIPLVILFPHVRKRIKQSTLRNVPGPASESFWAGATRRMHGPLCVPFREQTLTSYGRAINIPTRLGDLDLAVSDPVALSAMFTTYREAYDLPRWNSDTMRSVFGPGLTSVRGKEHIRHRKQLNPVFSVRYLKEMVPTFNRVAQELIGVLREKTTAPRTEIDVSQYFSRYTLESVGRAALGTSFGSLGAEDGTDYSRALKEFGPTIVKLHPWRPLLPWLRRTFPLSFLQWATGVLPWPALRHMRAISDSVYSTSQQVLRRKKDMLKHGGDSLAREVGEGKDLMSVLLQQNMLSSPDAMSEDDMIGHMSLLLLAATDTTSTSITRAIEVLAQHPEAQAKLRQELLDATAGTGRTLADFDYDTYTNLPYLEAVVRETVRMYPSFHLSPRVAEQDTVLPLGTPIQGTDGRTITELVVPAHTMVWVNILGLNRDKAIWGPDAHEWKPERWLGQLPASVADAHIPNVFSNTMTFVAGPRSCIGYNMALTEMRIALAHLVLAFEFAPSDKEIIWRLGGVVSPSVKGSTSKKPEFPVVISRV
ncbi:cytochrome P450 [Polyporus arcularius HHB13444]|uniref:Cytochrome P450 n=1 Tax=Polyporus arcularius HHB13444 TaxID=1314778 RepID=A0A5C3PN42_9APHY|nr:cytochrome P450 [Polyporus arcularius HHB13444]